MSPKISVIIPVYNVENYIRACLDSILQQTFQDWECILVNDGSKDNSGKICDEYRRLDSRFKVIHKDNGGVSSARNRGLDIATGEWFTFVDSDDELTKDALSYMLKRCISNEADCCVCAIIRESEGNNFSQILNDKNKRDIIWSCLTYRTQKYADRGLLVDAPYAKLFRASIIKENNIRYVEGLCKSEDALFTAEYYYHAQRIISDNHPVYYYTLNPNSICHTYSKTHISMLASLLELEQEFVDRYYEPEFENVVKVRAASALLQVLYESNARKRPLQERIEALSIFLNSGNVDSIISATKYSEIKPYFSNELTRIEFWLAKKHCFTSLCMWIDLSVAIFKVRVWLVSTIKRLLGIGHNEPIASIFSRK